MIDWLRGHKAAAVCVYVALITTLTLTLQVLGVTFR
jgi:hypothetical protein